MEEITLEWLSEVAPEMLDVEDDEPSGYSRNHGITVSSSCNLICGRRWNGRVWVPAPEIELHYIAPADYNYEGSTSLDHVTTRDEFRQLARLLTGREIG